LSIGGYFLLTGLLNPGLPRATQRDGFPPALDGDAVFILSGGGNAPIWMANACGGALDAEECCRTGGVSLAVPAV